MANESEPKVRPDEFWMKTRFFREGPYLSVVSTAVCKGCPEIFRARIDLRPFELAVRKYHRDLHAERSGATSVVRDAVNASPAALKPRTEETRATLTVPRVPVEGCVGADDYSIVGDWLRITGSKLPGSPGWDKLGPGGTPINKTLQTHMSNATNEDRRRWTFFAIAAARAGYWRGDPSHKPDWAYYATHPDDPWWQATPERKKAHDHFVDVAKTFKWEIHDSGNFITDIGHAIGKIPVLGDITSIAAEALAAPLNLAKNVATGQRLDHALMGALKDQVKIVKDVAPYAQTVASFIPGIGTGVSAMIGAGTALAEGKSLDEATKAAIKGALPGGPAAAAAFDTATRIASGENVGKAALEGARNLVPPGPAQKAFDVGIAVATGEKLQNVVARAVSDIAPEGLAKVVQAGQRAIQTVPGLSAAKKLIPAGAASQGFDVATGLLSHAGMNQKAIEAVRGKLAAEARRGFDAALKSQEKHVPWIGNVLSGASAIGKSAETMGKAALIKEVSAFRNTTLRRAHPNAPHLPEPKIPGALASAPTAALAAYAAANQAWNSIENGKDAATAVNRIVQANKIVNQVRSAAAKVGPALASKSLASSPALKNAVTTALAVKNASKTVTPAVVSRAVGAQTAANRKIADLAAQMKHSPDAKMRQAAATSLKILKIVSDNRGKLTNIANRAMQNVPHVGCCVGGDPGRIGCSPDVGCGCVGCGNVGAHHGGIQHFANVHMGELPGGYHPHQMTVGAHHGGIQHFANVHMGELPGGYHPHQMTVGAHHGGIQHFANVHMGELPGGYHPHQMTVGATYHNTGSSGRMVRKWQLFLNRFPGNHLLVDGVYGPGTKAATRTFQAMYDLKPDGILGGATLNKALQIQDSMQYPGIERDLRVSGHHGGIEHFKNVRLGRLQAGYHPHQMRVSGRIDDEGIEAILTNPAPEGLDDVVGGRPRPMAERHARRQRRFQIADGIAAIDRASVPEDPELIALCMQQIRRNRALAARP